MTTDSGAKTSAAARRRKAILDAAYDLFITRGYGSVSIDEIIRVSGGSKSTLYKMFGSKEGIMKEVIETLAAEMLRQIRIEPESSKTVREVLAGVGRVLVAMALSESAINQFRLAVANAGQFSEVAVLWYESGPKSTMDGFAKLLEAENDKGRLKIDDPHTAAWFFAGMLLFRENMIRLVGAPSSGKDEMSALVEKTVDAFLKVYAP